ncbi:MAG: septum formation protein Maf [Rhodospirillaceae bacterium]|nr:septum formation protein Maf [Rhodospirillaceae bacterium]|tara:strand:+ start:3819 stop:4430 length:612 start_codon:yes stop_codon:yes gene_type:complete
MEMNKKIILASGSKIRQKILSSAGITFLTDPANIDEDTIKVSLEKNKNSPEEIAQTLSDFKGLNRINIWPNDLIISCDQILSFNGEIFSKPKNKEIAMNQIKKLRGSNHLLITASTIIENSEIIWRDVSKAEMFMRELSDNQVFNYIEKIGIQCTKSVGGYMIENEGIKLFNKINGDYFTILGIPLTKIINFLFEKDFINDFK